MLRGVGTPIPSPSAGGTPLFRRHSRRRSSRVSAGAGSSSPLSPRDVTDDGAAVGGAAPSVAAAMPLEGRPGMTVLGEALAAAGALPAAGAGDGAPGSGGSVASASGTDDSSEDEFVEEVKELAAGTAQLALPVEVEPVPRKKRFAIIFCEDEAAWVDELPRECAQGGGEGQGFHRCPPSAAGRSVGQAAAAAG
jgi:hypothetical protein